VQQTVRAEARGGDGPVLQLLGAPAPLDGESHSGGQGSEPVDEGPGPQHSAGTRPVTHLGERGRQGGEPEPTGPVTDWATVTADASSLSFSAPADWKVIKASEIQTDEAKLEEVANEAGVSADTLKTAMSTADIYILDQSGAQDFSNNINVLSRTYSSATVTEDAMTTGIKSIGATPGQFSTESTANGDARVLTYTWDLGGQTLQGAAMYVPNTEGKYASVTITTLDAALTGQIADTIIATAS